MRNKAAGSSICVVDVIVDSHKYDDSQPQPPEYSYRGSQAASSTSIRPEPNGGLHFASECSQMPAPLPSTFDDNFEVPSLSSSELNGALHCGSEGSQVTLPSLANSHKYDDSQVMRPQPPVYLNSNEDVSVGLPLSYGNDCGNAQASELNQTPESWNGVAPNNPLYNQPDGTIMSATASQLSPTRQQTSRQGEAVYQSNSIC